jgi:hypothetical protein
LCPYLQNGRALVVNDKQSLLKLLQMLEQNRRFGLKTPFWLKKMFSNSRLFFAKKAAFARR